MMIESWFGDPAVITGDVAFARTKLQAHIKSTRGVLLREDRGSARMFDVRGWAIGPIALQMPQFITRLGTLRDLQPPQELGELRFHAQD
jgi:hypothetical protein